MTTTAAVLHGIPNCDTVKKARTWLESNGVDYTFHDFKKQGVSAEMLAGWLAQVPSPRCSTARAPRGARCRMPTARKPRMKPAPSH